MTKKTIILVLIFLLVINTIFWLYMGIRVYRYIRVCTIGGKNWYIEYSKIKESFGGSMILTFEDTYPHTPFIILAITDAVLIAISFMIILLYKNK